MFCQKCGKEVPKGAQFCAACGEATGSEFLPASALRRLANFFIDRVLVVVIVFASIFLIASTHLNQAFESFYVLIAMFFYVIYFLICESIWQKTLGKVITKTKVVDMKGNKPSFWRILGRSCARYIPFDQFSFLGGAGFPIGWHDSISGTLVVSDKLTTEEIVQIRRDRKGGVTPLLIVVIVLFMIAIIGILSSVILASLNTARQRGMEASIKATVTSLRAQGELYADGNDGSYKGFCNDSRAVGPLNEATASAKQPASSYVCNDFAKSWAASGYLSSGTYWCVDSTGRFVSTIANNLTEVQTECPTSVIKTTPSTTNTAISSTVAWTSYPATDGSFSVSFPRQPKITSAINSPIEGTNLAHTWYHYEANDEIHAFFVFADQYIGDLGAAKPNDLLASYLDLISGRGKLISSSYGTYRNLPAVDFVLSAQDEMLKGKILLDNKKFYLIMMDYFPEGYDATAYDTFMNSFQLK